jgi:hypothetical protein
LWEVLKGDRHAVRLRSYASGSDLMASSEVVLGPAAS